MAHCFRFLETIVFAYVFVMLTCAASLLNDGEECLALYQFKQSFHHQDGASFDARFDSWTITNHTSHKNGSGSDCCLWDGVECSNEEEDTHVIGLDLSEGFLHGHLRSNSTLFDLVHLQILNMAENNFVESPIPSTLSRLKQLRILNLSYSNFSGQIPGEIGALTQLSSLDLSYNPLTLHGASFENLVRNLTRLEELDLSDVDISSSVPYFLANFSSLSSIKLDSCRLRNDFPVAIFHLPKLKILSLYDNTNITGFIPELQGNNSQLEHLDLVETGFFGILPQSIGNLKHLTYLDLSQCFFTGRIPSSLSNLTRLTGLGMGGNKFTNELPSLASLSELTGLEIGGIKFENKRLPNWLGKLAKLKDLYAYEMDVHGEIPPLLANLTKLTALRMQRNSLSGPIPSSFLNHTQLSVLSLAENHLQGQIPCGFSSFINLQLLELHDNNFTGEVELDVFLGLRKLETLWLGGNRISLVSSRNHTNDTLPQFKSLNMRSCNLNEVPAFLRFQHQMESLLLDNNKIVGRLPIWSWNNSKETLKLVSLGSNFFTGFPQLFTSVFLKVLTISNNDLVGPLPIPRQTIVVYQASQNRMTGEIPPSLCELKSLQILDLSSNNFTGNLPRCFNKLSSSLQVLSIKRNDFEGAMMDSFMHGSPLKRLDLSENRFRGNISRSLGNCTALEFLSLGDNSFDDVFPVWLGTLPALQILILRSNKLHGAIQVPANLQSQFPKLHIIDLSNNLFSGELPHEYIQGWNAMKSAYEPTSFPLATDVKFDTIDNHFAYSMTLITKGVKQEYQRILNIFTAIDLSSNSFQGRIPGSLQGLQGLQSLNLSNNHLTGQILPSLGNLTNLESLDLSGNDLTGAIPRQLLQLGFLAIFNVSFNHLQGAIPHGKQFDTFDNNSYIGNSRLCGMPLSKECHRAKSSTPAPTTDKSESLLPSERIDWIIIFIGVGCGLVIGIVIGNIIYARYNDWFMERLGMKEDRWVRPLRKKRRN